MMDTSKFGQRLPSGITVGEALERAEAWWHEYRGATPEQFTQYTQMKGRVSRTTKSGLLLRIKDVILDHEVGNILRGAPWKDLTTKERLEVVKIWHNYVLLDGCTDGKAHVDPNSVRMQ